jgi:hypothetical protein
VWNLTRHYFPVTFVSKSLSQIGKFCIMASTSTLVTLASSLRAALEAPLIAESQADQDARLDILDMLPLVSRKLVGEVQTIRDMVWEVGEMLPVLEPQSLIPNYSG